MGTRRRSIPGLGLKRLALAPDAWSPVSRTEEEDALVEEWSSTTCTTTRQQRTKRTHQHLKYLPTLFLNLCLYAMYSVPPL